MPMLKKQGYRKLKELARNPVRPSNSDIRPSQRIRADLLRIGSRVVVRITGIKILGLLTDCNDTPG